MLVLFLEVVYASHSPHQQHASPAFKQTPVREGGCQVPLCVQLRDKPSLLMKPLLQ
jgi:hypothetical protein